MGNRSLLMGLKNMKSILAFVFAALLCAEAANREGAQLIVHKVFDKIPVVFDQPVNVTVTIYNVGTGDATDVALVDGVSGDSFEVADDMSLTADFDVIAPGESAKHFYTVTPKSTGQAGLNRATVEYSYIEDDSEDEMPGRVFSSALYVEYGKGGLMPGVFQIMSEQEFQEMQSTYNRELIIFWVIAAFNPFAPYYLYSAQSEVNTKARLS